MKELINFLDYSKIFDIKIKDYKTLSRLSFTEKLLVLIHHEMLGPLQQWGK